MNKRANLYFAALLGAMSPLSTVTALAAQSNSVIANRYPAAKLMYRYCKGRLLVNLSSVLPSESMARPVVP